MARLDFAFDARFFEPLQPEDTPAQDTPADSPKLVTTLAASTKAHDSAEPVVSDAEQYRVWQEECKQINEGIRLAYERYLSVQEEARLEIQRIQDNVRRVREDWLTLRATPKPLQPKSSRRRK